MMRNDVDDEFILTLGLIKALIDPCFAMSRVT